MRWHARAIGRFSKASRHDRQRRPRARPEPAAKQKLRLWLRLLRASRTIEAELRERLRVEFGMTLPKFDVMAALDRKRAGMTMTESRAS